VRAANLAGSLIAAATLLVASSRTDAAAEIHYESSGASLTGRISIAETSQNRRGTQSGNPANLKLPILHLHTSISVPRESAYPDDACVKDAKELTLLGDFDFARFAKCPVVVTGVLLLDQSGCSLAGIQVAKLECTDTGETAGTVPLDFPWKNERKDRFACDPNEPPVLFIAGFPPPGYIYSDREMWSPDLWVAAEHLMRSSSELRFSEDALNEVKREQASALKRLWDSFPALRNAAMETEYLPYTLEIQFAPSVQSELDERLRSLGARRGSRFSQPLPAGFTDLCATICLCWIWRTPEGANRMVFAPTTNLLSVIRRLRESPDVAGVHLVKDPWYQDRTRREYLLVRRMPTAFRFTLESPDPRSGQMSREFFEVDASGARRVAPTDQAEILSFTPDPLPTDLWR